jgi:hypothetical protein
MATPTNRTERRGFGPGMALWCSGAMEVSLVPLDLESQHRLSINVGPLNGLGSLCLHTARQLKRFSRMYLSGNTPQVEWDLRQLEPRHINMSALTGFLAIAARMREVARHRQFARIQFNPRVFAFWDDIRFLQVVRDLDLFDWVPANIVGGYGAFAGRTNPNTRVLAFPKSAEVPSESLESTPEEDVERNQWKDYTREQLTCELLVRCGAIFQVDHRASPTDKRFVAQIAKSAAELILNSHYWGRAAAFVGLQRSTVGVTVTVCDVGYGFLATLRKQRSRKQIPIPTNHIEALVLGSFLNREVYGLRAIIDEVIARGGWVSLSSYDAEIRWGEGTWLAAKRFIGSTLTDHSALLALIDQLGGVSTRVPGDAQRRRSGYLRTFADGLRGVRIAFELPLS